MRTECGPPVLGRRRSAVRSGGRKKEGSARAFWPLVGAVGFSRPRPLMQYRRLIAERSSFDDALAATAEV